MDYPLEQLGPERFQHFCQALLVRELPNTQCFPVGQPDGGRDAVASHASGQSSVVFQIKFVRNPSKTNDVLEWLSGIIDDEIEKVKRLAGRGAKKYYLMTNLSGTSHLDAGSIDKVQKVLNRLPVDSICLWRDDLNRRLDTAWQLKWTYPELMTGPDLIHSIIESGLSENRERRTSAIRAFVKDQYTRDAEVKFKQVELQNNLLDLFIDVPVQFSDRQGSRNKFHEVNYALWQVHHDVAPGGPGEEGDDPGRFMRHDEPVAGGASLLLHPIGQRLLERTVLEGAPGQGKSTITQYVCQVHRMRILASGDLESLTAAHRNCPVRLPFRIDLRDLAAWLERIDPFSMDSEQAQAPYWSKSLESFLAAQVRYHSGGTEFTVDDLIAVLKISSILFVFDGLDEVAVIKQRQSVVDEIVAGIKRLEANAAGMQVVVTSRPAAFANSPGLPRASFPYLQLIELPRTLVDEYSEKWISARRISQSDAKEVRRILKEKLDAPHLRDLARNPMQLAILLSLIHTRGVSLPDKRTALYDNYVELFFNREAEKSSVVREHRYLLVDIHRHLAWILHGRAETGKGRGSIRADELESLIQSYLRNQGHEPSLAKILFNGIVERVVAIVSRVQGTYEFEVQPLREYFAARHLYETAPYSPPGNERSGTKPDRFEALARNFYWLNVTRFYAGCYSAGELLPLLTVCEISLNQRTTNIWLIREHWRQCCSLIGSLRQHPRSVRDVLALLLDGSGLQFYIASSDQRRGNAPYLVLPSDAGRSDLLGRAVALLKTDPPLDIAYQTISLIAQNNGTKEFHDIWRIETMKRVGDARLKWLNYGTNLGYISHSDSRELDSLYAELPMLGATVSSLLRSQKGDWIEENSDRFNSAALAILNNPYLSSNRKPKKLIEALCTAVDPERYVRIFYNPSNEQVVKSFDGRRGQLIEPSKIETPRHSYFRDVWEIVDVIWREVQRPALDWATSIVPWDTVVESIRPVYGENDTCTIFANLAAGIRAPREQCSDASDVLNSSLSLCRRVRYARLRAGQPQWWSRQLEKATSAAEREFLLMLLLVSGKSFHYQRNDGPN